jgi:ATP-binding cassette subfamily C (CFTR/MRP) protein 1
MVGSSSGKSSLILALFRLVEPCGGSIVIDGLDVSSLGLAALRKAITIIPQVR